MAHLAKGDSREAWRTLRRWYRVAEGKAAKPCYHRLEAQTVEREKLYDHVPPPGEKIPCNADRPRQNDEAPSDAEIREAAKRCGNGRAGGGSRMRAEDLRKWLRGAELEEEKEGYEGAGDTWRLVVRLIRHIWETGEIPRQMLWTIVVLIPKGNSGEFRGIGLLEVLWKIIEKVLDARLSSIELHDCLHGFRAGRGCGTGIMEAKLVQ